MINKKNVLGKRPHDLGLKDAIHTAIVSVRAGAPIKPGQRCGMNEHQEAVADSKGPGVADPFLKKTITTGQAFWMLLDQDSVPSVRHEWDHPTVDFAPPTREMKLNRSLQECAKTLGVTYEQVMEAAEYVVENESPAKYPGSLSADEFEAAWDKVDSYELWSEWADEVGHEFYNRGTECCPEYDYPDELFEVS